MIKQSLDLYRELLQMLGRTEMEISQLVQALDEGKAAKP